MPGHGQIASDEELQSAGSAGTKGFIIGASRWGFYTGVVTGILYFVSPVYRSLTFQFKVYIQMSGMTVGGILEAESRFREHQKYARRWRKLRSDQEVWKRYEEEYGDNGERTTPPAITNKERRA